MEFLQVSCLSLVGFISFGVPATRPGEKARRPISKKIIDAGAGNEFILRRNKAVIR
jgi:hypothetical protein